MRSLPPMARHHPLPLLVSLSCFIQSGALLQGRGMSTEIASRPYRVSHSSRFFRSGSHHLARSSSALPTVYRGWTPSVSYARKNRPVGSRSLVASATVVETSTGLNELLQSRNGVSQRFVFFGGKGGVGKTSTAASVAIQCADAGLRTLVISTDPAHSLGDALDQNVSGGKPVRVTGMDNLEAMEVDTEEAVKEFETALKAFDVTALATEMGISQDMVESFGLSEITEVLQNPPPGLDELVALSRVINLAQAQGNSFDRVVIDTAPTGHTLRLLSFPDFLDKFIDKVIQLRSRIGGLLDMFKSMMGTGDTLVDKTDQAVEKLKGYREKMVDLQNLFRNQDATEFCIVTIPTQLAIAETKRLLLSLQEQGLAVRNVVVNQVMNQSSSSDYLSRLRRGQESSMARLDGLGGNTGDLDISKVPFFDMEVTGVYPLRYMGNVAYGGKNEVNWKELSSADGQRFVIVGGKGGVGKTSNSAALAVKMADEGYSTVVVSTDPAHSLGDALQIPLKGGELTPVPGIMGSGSLYGLEVDTEGAIEEYKKVVDDFLSNAQSKAQAGDTTSSMLNQLQLGDFASVLDSAPPGTDELVALSKVLKLVRGDNDRGLKFDRVIIDTAPTGHTLRMLGYPEFLDNFFEKLIQIRNKLKGATNMLSMFSGGGLGGVASAEADATLEEDRDRLREFQYNMIELQELFQNKEKSEFVVVTIPSVLAVAESERLVKQLHEQDVPVKHVIINKVVTEDVQEGYIERLSRGQAAGVTELEGVARGAGVALTQVPFFDVEVRNIYGLRYMAQTLFAQQQA